MSAEILPAALLKRKAVVYVRQSTQTQVQTNLEGRRRLCGRCGRRLKVEAA
jgi:hypothetical protein